MTLRERSADIWADRNLDVICITTNGTVLNSGVNIMGGGIAKEAAERVPTLPKTYGDILKNNDLGVHVLHVYKEQGFADRILLAFPTKYTLMEPANMNLIETSMTELIVFAGIFHMYRIGLPRPGTGIGGLDWENEVKPLLEDMIPMQLRNRITIYSYPNESLMI